DHVHVVAAVGAPDTKERSRVAVIGAGEVCDVAIRTHRLIVSDSATQSKNPKCAEQVSMPVRSHAKSSLGEPWELMKEQTSFLQRAFVEGGHYRCLPSIVVGEQEARGGAIGFGDDPELCAPRRAV